ncbi:MAG: chromosomal replication initiator protein DnaA [Myxococcales bacterium]|nr:chromosomal replication initiator protein DnaA [Myxococcales bacterium]
MLELWTEAVRSIEPLIKPAHRDLWLRPIECVDIDEGRIRLRAPNRYHKEWFEDNFLPSILKDLETRTQRTYVVDFEVGEDAAPIPAVAVPGLARIVAESRIAAEGRSPSSVPMALRPKAPELVTRYTFEKFVVGPTNQFAHAAARMVAEAPASKWNPLFIYGGVGLGKTHLLHAIGHAIHERQPEWNVSFITGEKFVTDFIGSIQKRQGGNGSGGGNSMEDFRQRYRNAPDVLLVDDVQFLSNKDSSQDEFFHTFNALHYAHKQIVLTSDKLPAELPGVEDRLRSRFTWGLIAEVETPDLETRVAILKQKAEVDKVFLPDDVALYLAAHVKSNVRELEGALIRLAARASFQGQTITLEVARDALAKLFANAPTGLTIEGIQREVASYFDVKLHDLKGPKRHRAIAHPRMIAMFLARKLTNMSYPEIGSRFGGKDHSTVISAVKKIERLCGEDPTVRSVVGTIESHLRSP